MGDPGLLRGGGPHASPRPHAQRRRSEDAPPVVAINEHDGRTLLAGRGRPRQRFRMGGPGSTRPMLTIVGIVKTFPAQRGGRGPSRRGMYCPTPNCRHRSAARARSMAIVIKTQGRCPGTDRSPARRRSCSRSELAGVRHSNDGGSDRNGVRGTTLRGVPPRHLRDARADAGGHRNLRHESPPQSRSGRRRSAFEWPSARSARDRHVDCARRVAAGGWWCRNRSRVGALLRRVCSSRCSSARAIDPVTFVLVPVVLVLVAVCASLLPRVVPRRSIR